jgi:hypothetical protein
MDEKTLPRYLKQMKEIEKDLEERETLLDDQLKHLNRKKLPDDSGYASIEDRILEYAYGHKSENEGISGNHYSQDALYQVWEKVYKPYEMERKRILDEYCELWMERISLNCMKSSIYALETKEKDLIVHVYLEGMKTAQYCRSEQIGHSTYTDLKKQALSQLLMVYNRRMERFI